MAFHGDQIERNYGDSHRKDDKTSKAEQGVTIPTTPQAPARAVLHTPRNATQSISAARAEKATSWNASWFRGVLGARAFPVIRGAATIRVVLPFVVFVMPVAATVAVLGFGVS